MYTEQDLIHIKDQQKKRWMALGIPCLILLGGLIASLVVRIEWLTALLTILIGAILIAGYDLYIRPLRRYQLFLQNALHGMIRETECYFQAISRSEEPVEGVMCRTMDVTDHDDEGKPYDRLFYFDALKEFPAMEPGQKLHITYHDRSVVDLKLL